MHARDLMTTPLITCHANDSLSIAAKQMWDADIGALAVVNEEGRVTGMITDRDICMAAYTQGRALTELLVGSAMARNVVSASPDAILGEVERLMAIHQVRRIPIVDPDNKPVGMISMNDLAIECARINTDMKHGASKIAHTLAAICAHRAPLHRAA